MLCVCGAPTIKPAGRGRPRKYCDACEPAEVTKSRLRARQYFVPKVSPETLAKRAARNEQFAAMYREGLTLQQIGDRFGVTRERVRQVLRKCSDVTAMDGGQHLRAKRRREAAQRKKDAEQLLRWGCTLKQRWSIPSKARLAFSMQRKNAEARGIDWQITLWDWWQIWLASGKWNERGRTLGCYVMSRFADSGPYAPWNVRIVTCSENISEYFALKRRAAEKEQVAA